MAIIQTVSSESAEGEIKKATASICSWIALLIEIIRKILPTPSQLYQISFANSCHDHANSLISL